MASTAFKKSMCTAALDLPGTKKSQIGRLAQVVGYTVPIYGDPRMFMAPVRLQDMSRTLDIRTRAIFPEWACRIDVLFAPHLLTPQGIANLLSAAGMFCGVGDYRVEKGAGDFGCFRLCAPDDPDYMRITTASNRQTQRAALDHPVAFNWNTAEMFQWFTEEIERRQKAGNVAETKLKVA